jgi:hypothetical protein
MRWLFIVALLAVFVYGLEQVAVAPLETGDVYPPYSSLRSDPLGAKALYESLAALPNLTVERLYKERATLDGPRDTMFVLGVDPVGWATVKDKTLEEYEQLVQNGGRMVIAFLPVRPRIEQHESKRAIEERWHLRLKYRPGLYEDIDAVPRETALSIDGSPDWRPLTGHGAIVRTFGKGEIVIAPDSFPLSNQGLIEERDAPFLAALAGPARRVIFDENHFGVAETGSVTTLMRKYHLEGAIAVLALAAALFLWRNATSFLPPREARTDDAVTGRDSMEGMTALLHRGVPEKDLLNACFAEWTKSAPRQTRAANVEEAIRANRDPVKAYRAATRALAATWPPMNADQRRLTIK